MPLVQVVADGARSHVRQRVAQHFSQVVVQQAAAGKLSLYAARDDAGSVHLLLLISG